MEDLQQEYAQQVEEQVQGSGIGIQGNAAKSSEAAPDKDSKRWVKLDLEKRFINSGEGIPVDLGLLQAAADLIYSKKRIMCGFAESEIANLTERLSKAEQAMRAAPALRALPERLEAAVIWETTLVEACVCAGLESDDFASLPERIREWRRKAEKRGAVRQNGEAGEEAYELTEERVKVLQKRAMGVLTALMYDDNADVRAKGARSILEYLDRL